MDIASNFESHTDGICRNAFQTHFSKKITFKLSFVESVNFQKNALISSSLKTAKTLHGLWWEISCFKFRVVSDSEALLK